MTAEIVIMNKEAVALAADSAMSLIAGPGDRPHKIFTAANKIFELSAARPVSIMIYNNSSFMGIPWETIIRVYTRQSGRSSFKTLGEYADHFITFLSSAEDFIPRTVQERYFASRTATHFLYVRYLIQQRATQVLQAKGGISEEEIADLTRSIVEEIAGRLESAPFAPSMDEPYRNRLLELYGEVVRQAEAEVFENLPIPDDVRQRIRQIAVSSFVKASDAVSLFSQDFSGIVITGFGEGELFPSMRSFNVEGMIEHRLKYTETERHEITFENGAVIVPFAQREVVDIFLSGMDPRFEQAIVASLDRIFHEYPPTIIDSIEKLDDDERRDLKERFLQTSDELIVRLRQQLQGYRVYNYGPIMNVVTTLPKSEMAALAESLVNLTSLKRRVSLEAETVGGPVDVAVISKGDGFVWIKKKQYFRPALNMRPTAYREEVNDVEREEGT